MKKREQNKSELNVFTYGRYKITNIYSLVFNIKQFFRNIEFAWQRATRGYCDWDAWDLDIYYTKLLIDSLAHLRDHTHGYPGRDEWPTEESWTEYLTEIIVHLQNYANEETEENYIKSEECFEVFKNEPDIKKKNVFKSQWLDYANKSYEYRKSERAKALEMLHNCWDHLWD